MSTNIQKLNYSQKLHNYLDKYQKGILVNCDNVGSHQFQDIRRATRGSSVILMGKNTLIKRCVRNYLDERGAAGKIWERLVDSLVGNVGIIFTKGDLFDVRSEILKFTVGAPARVGAVASCDVTVYAGNTGMDPSATSFFQALNIPTKINKGMVEIISDMTVIKKGDRVGSSEAALLAKLNIKPFSYGLLPVKVFEHGTVYDPKILDLKDDDLESVAQNAVRHIAAISLTLRIPTLASVPYLVIDGYRNVLAAALATNYSFPEVEKIKKVIENPEVLRVAEPITTACARAPAATSGPTKKPESESEEIGGLSIFD